MLLLSLNFSKLQILLFRFLCPLIPPIPLTHLSADNLNLKMKAFRGVIQELPDYITFKK